MRRATRIDFDRALAFAARSRAVRLKGTRIGYLQVVEHDASMQSPTACASVAPEAYLVTQTSWQVVSEPQARTH
jgi:hypothetical protein